MTGAEGTLPPVAYDYPEQLPDRLTGGFGEQTCHSCHFDYPLNYEEGRLQVEGLPKQYEGGRSYMLRIYVGRPGLEKAGFQLTARFADGRQAGMFSPQSDRTLFTEGISDSVQYVQHSAKGTDITGDERTLWTVKWIAPKKAGAVVLHIAANAGNGDASEFGDYILTQKIHIPAAR